jgi:predicted TIM-barrel fold metal-dependent hydrolase
MLSGLPEMVVFSSDYPHYEGNSDPIELYRPALDDLDGEVRASFLGDNIGACFERVGAL